MLQSVHKTFLISQQKWSKTYYDIQKIAIGQEDDYTTGCLLDHPYFREI